MSLNFKNTLQEYCQKNKLQLPHYTSTSIGNSHCLQWSCTVSVSDVKFTTGKLHSSKKQAEQEAAENACNKLIYKQYVQKETNILDLLGSVLPNTTPPNKSVFDDLLETKVDPVICDLPINNQSSNTFTIVLVDLENVQPIISKIPDNTIIYCFLSTYSTVDVNKYVDLCKVIKVDSGVADAADHLITYQAGKLLSVYSTDTKFVIASRDRSSAVLATLLTQDKYKVTHFKTARELEEFLNRKN
jgi:hypothetical protein